MSNITMKEVNAKLKEATDLDTEGKYEAAVQAYNRGLKLFLHIIKYEKHEGVRKEYQKTANKYMNRMELLQQTLVGKQKQANAAVTEESGDKERDARKKAMQDAIVTQKPNVHWDDIGGLLEAKNELKKTVIAPFKLKKLFKGKRQPPKGILLYGPPGTGKSYLAKAVATEAESAFFSISSADLVSKWVGEGEKMVRQLFQTAREMGPSVIFIDEVDSLLTARGGGDSNESSARMKTEFLVQTDGVQNLDFEKRVLLLGATNLPWALDTAMRRRFQRKIYIPLPDAEARSNMFKINLKSEDHTLTAADFVQIGLESEGYSGADIETIVQDALMDPVDVLMKCEFFRENEDGMFDPVFENPPCPFCPMKLSTTPKDQDMKCVKCGAVRMGVFDLPEEKIRDPVLSLSELRRSLKKIKPSVSPNDLDKYVKWTEEFGIEGS